MGVSEGCRSEKEDVLKVKEGGLGHEPEVWTDPLVVSLQPSGASGGPTMDL